MINCYTGRPGNGKSYHACFDVYSALRSGVNVLSNINIDESKVKPNWIRSKLHKPMGHFIYVPTAVMECPNFCKAPDKCSFGDCLRGFSLNFHDWSKDNKTKEGQTLIVIDECQVDGLLNCRTWNNPTRRDWNEFFQLHRHYGFDIILVTQSLPNIDKQTQKLVQMEVEHRKFSNFNGLCKLISRFFMKEFFVCVKRDLSLKRTPTRARMGFSVMVSKAFIYKLYNSYLVEDIRHKAPVTAVDTGADAPENLPPERAATYL